ncbi:MAG: IS1182 family transposase [Candidatus Omnitrophica bacterium]|nr:IS1182 family transposase [Candidatus Omnitrophota bacterium]
MMRVKQKESKMFYNFSLSSRIPKEHFLRNLDEVIDFSFIYKLARPYYSHTGQPGIDPVVLLKMMLIGYLYNITSERKLAQELRVNLAFMYFLGYDIDEETPNHSILSKARRRFGNKIFEQFFEIVIEKCKQKELIQAEKTFVDSTLIPANASLSSIVDCDEKIILRRSPKAYLKAVDELNPVESEDDKEQKREKPKLQANQKSYSKTDPDASIIRHHNTQPKLAYKQHIGVDNGPARIITACATTPAAVADEHKLPHLISKAKEQHDILPKEVGADTKYGTADNYRFLLESQIKPSIPHHGGKNATGLLTKDNFIYDKEKDQYICPEGKILRNTGFAKQQRHYVYRTNSKVCKACKFLKECTKSPTGRSVTRHVNESFLEQAKEHLNAPSAKATIKQRGEYVETVFACEKKDLGLNKAKFRGIISVHIQSLLTAAAYNLKKLVKYSRGFKKKLKTVSDLPILPILETNIARLKQGLRDSEPVIAVSNLVDSLFLFFKHILGCKLAYNMA